MSDKKRALVLGCGAVAGAAWSIPVLNELQKQTGFAPEQADYFVGTSVGAMLSALLAGGVTVDSMMASQRGDAMPSHCQWDHDLAVGPALPPLPKAKFNSLKLVQAALKGDVSWLTGVSGLLPQGAFDMQHFERLIGSVQNKAGWLDHDNCWLVAVDCHSGERVPFGAKGAPKARAVEAACASYGVPGWCPAVSIDGVDYIDGGVASPTSADLLLNTDVDEVYVIAPMASTFPDKPTRWAEKIERAARRYMTSIVDDEIAKLKLAGKTVVRIEPQADDLAAFGFNMMDAGRRELVFNTALKTCERTVSDALKVAGLSPA